MEPITVFEWNTDRYRYFIEVNKYGIRAAYHVHGQEKLLAYKFSNSILDALNWIKGFIADEGRTGFNQYKRK